MNEITKIKVIKNHWRIPSKETAFSGWVEGAPTDQERSDLLKKIESERTHWKPNVDALKLSEQLQVFIGQRVKIEFWDPCMVVLNEGPSPLLVDVVGITLLEVDGFTQAFIEIENEVEVAIADLYSPLGYLLSHEGSRFKLASLADLYIISKVEKESLVP